MIKKAQLCGSYTGIGRTAAINAFNKAKTTVRELGDYNIFSPVEKIDEHASYQESMNICLKYLIDEADCLFVLNNWEHSTGANIEVDVAKAIGKPIFFIGG
jgi:hypothetical protein